MQHFDEYKIINWFVAFARTRAHLNYLKPLRYLAEKLTNWIRESLPNFQFQYSYSPSLPLHH